jgi:hypothetical protein
MPEWIALSKTAHRDAGLLPRDGYRFAENERAVPVLLAELNKVIPHYLLGFVPRGEGYTPVAVLGAQDNAYLAPDGRWLGTYVPATLRGYPFALANAEDGQSVLAIDATLLASDDGEALFTEDGETSDTVNKSLDFLQQCEKNRAATAQAAGKLAEHHLLVPWELAVPTDAEGGTPVKLDGLYRVDEQALNALSGDVLSDLRGAPLALAYAQLFSTGQQKALADRLTFQAKHAEQQGDIPENLDSVLDDMDDDDLMFDFDS